MLVGFIIYISLYLLKFFPLLVILRRRQDFVRSFTPQGKKGMAIWNYFFFNANKLGCKMFRFFEKGINRMTKVKEILLEDSLLLALLVHQRAQLPDYHNVLWQCFAVRSSKWAGVKPSCSDLFTPSLLVYQKGTVKVCLMEVCFMNKLLTRSALLLSTFHTLLLLNKSRTSSSQGGQKTAAFGHGLLFTQTSEPLHLPVHRCL